jgi:hypothetical protein
MNSWRAILLGGLIISGVLMMGCDVTTPAPTADVETAVETALAQTRAVEDAVATSVAATMAANNTSAPATDTPEAPPSDTPQATTETSEPAPTDTPTPPAPTPTEEKLAIAQSLVDGDDGNDFLRGSSPDNQGRVILLPGFDQQEVSEPMVFRDRMVFQVEVFDTRVGLADGDGIQDVSFRIEVDDGSGKTVYERREGQAGYCAFGGGEPDCNVLTLENGSQWPDPYGGEIRSGEYVAKIDIVPEDGEATQWRWRFNIEIPGQSPAQPDNTARIDSVTVQDGRYVVDFETFGFEPLIPGQHIHFFFNTVPPTEAGIPGGGPWQIYPTGPDRPNTSPFTLYTVDQRPPNATQICILVANEDHSVIQDTGNCVDLP